MWTADNADISMLSLDVILHTKNLEIVLSYWIRVAYDSHIFKSFKIYWIQLMLHFQYVVKEW